ALRARACSARFAGKRGTTSVAQASSTRARAWRSTILPVSWLWTSMVFSSRWWGWFHNTILEADHVGLSCYGSYAYVRAYGPEPAKRGAAEPGPALTNAIGGGHSIGHGHGSCRGWLACRRSVPAGAPGQSPARPAAPPGRYRTAPEATAAGGGGDGWGPHQGTVAGCRRQPGTAAGGSPGAGAQ